MHTAELIGHGWEPWSGWWVSRRWLEVTGSGWSLVESDRVESRWSSFHDAVRDLWPRRRVRDRAPWAIGWLGYEECAALAGGLPARGEADAVPRGWWLLEPERCRPGTLPGAAGAGVGSVASSSLGDAEFCSLVERVRRHIEAGDVYQVNLTRRFRVAPWSGGLAPLAAAATRGGAPDYLSRFSFSGGELVCASMELLLRRRAGRVETRPIKGTRPRGGTADEDTRLMAELVTDAKEAAELAMIVDLERNDLGRVAEVGTVTVCEPGAVASYNTVHHRVARVTARVDESLPWWQLAAAMAPGGSVTGCPKHAAMDLIRGLEPIPRGPYTGMLGVVDGSGDLELALPIRSAWQMGDCLEFASGCGIVWDSDPEREELESRLKVARWLELCGLAGERAGDRGGLLPAAFAEDPGS